MDRYEAILLHLTKFCEWLKFDKGELVLADTYSVSTKEWAWRIGHSRAY
jgi:hypothetical protein